MDNNNTPLHQIYTDDANTDAQQSSSGIATGKGSEMVTSIGKGKESYAYTPEKTPSSEKEKSIEMEPLYEKQQKEEQSNTEEPSQPLLTKMEQPKAPIVDKSAEKPKLHHLEHTADKLTSRADTEEEEFIEKVEETAHGTR